METDKKLELSVKLIWDFRGADALAFAKHHALHLNEYLTQKSYPDHVAGSHPLTDFHAIAYLLCNRENMITLRDELKPHRAEKYEPQAG